MQYTIYLIEDHRMKPYIGMTSKSVEERFQQHKKSANYGVGYHLYNAMRKYVSENFEITPLDTAYTHEEACKLEKEWIYRLGTFEDWGYNMTTGGKSHKFSEEARQKISDSLQGKGNPLYGKSRDFSEEHLRNLSEANRGKSCLMTTKPK
jgi:group I intron endonuclease